MEKLKSGQTTELPCQVAAYPFFPKELLQHFTSVFGRWFAEGAINFEPERTLNDHFPDIKTWKVKEFLQKAW